MRILIVEDDREINKVLSDFLSDNGYDVENAYDGMAAMDKIKTNEYSLILLDLMLPMLSGERIIKETREVSMVPIIVISAKSAMEARLEVLKTGADDFILKPFDLDEVLVRIQVVLRRSVPVEKESTTNVYRIGDLELNEEEKSVSFKGEYISLTSKELQVLELLMKNPKKTFTKANLYEAVWEDVYYYEDNTINVHVSNLRNKLKKSTGQDYVETVWGIGYRLKEQ